MHPSFDRTVVRAMHFDLVCEVVLACAKSCSELTDCMAKSLAFGKVIHLDDGMDDGSSIATTLHVGYIYVS